MITVRDIEEIRKALKEEFPDAVRGSVCKSRWGKGRKTLHLSYFIGSDTVGGHMIQAKGNLLYFIEWDTNNGHEYKFAESEIKDMVCRVRKMFYGKLCKIQRIVGE